MRQTGTRLGDIKGGKREVDKHSGRMDEQRSEAAAFIQELYGMKR
jgi:hypothetical protein